MPVLRLPYLYELTYVAAKGRVERPILAKGYHDFEVPEASSAEAPAYLEWTWEQTEGREARRAFEGRSYRPLGRKAPVDADGLLEALSSQGDATYWRGDWRFMELPAMPVTARNRTVPERRSTTHYATEADVVAQGRVVRHDRGRGVAQGADAWREGLLFVDGEAWVAAPEPTYVVVDDDDHVYLHCMDRVEPMLVSARFRADAVGVAQASAMAEADARGLAYMDLTEGRRVVVHDPDALVSDPATLLAGCVMDRGLMAVREEWPSAVRAAYATIEACRRVPEAAREADWPATILAATSAFCAGLASSAAARGDYPDVVRGQVREFRAVARAWDDVVGPAMEAARGVALEDDATLAGMSF